MIRTLVIPVLVVIIAVFLARNALESSIKRQIEAPIGLNQGVDFFMESPSASSYDALTGRLSANVQADRLNYYTAEKRTEMLAPRVEVAAEDGNWLIQAAKASQSEINSPILLQGSVTMSQQSENSSGINFYMPKLKLDLNTNMAEGFDQVLVTSPTAETRAQSMRADLNTKQVYFNKNVSTTLTPRTSNNE